MADKLQPVPNYLYLHHTNEMLWLPEYPDSVMDKMNSTFSQTNALSRTAPVFAYSNSGPRQVQVQLHIHRDMLKDINLDNVSWSVEGEEDPLDALVRKLQSIALPVYQGTELKPPMVSLQLGNTIFIKGVIIGGVSIEYQKPILDGDVYSQCNLNFEIFEVEPYDATSVGQLGSFRGITSTFKNFFN